jgi:hypothetical protein
LTSYQQGGRESSCRHEAQYLYAVAHWVEHVDVHLMAVRDAISAPGIATDHLERASR